MTNSAIINISSPAGSHTVVVQQDVDNRRTINASLDTAEHDLYECSASVSSSGDNATLNGLTDIHVPFWVFRGDKVTLSVDVPSSTARLQCAQAGIDASGVLAAGQSAALVAFIKACGLPDLAA